MAGLPEGAGANLAPAWVGTTNRFQTDEALLLRKNEEENETNNLFTAAKFQPTMPQMPATHFSSFLLRQAVLAGGSRSGKWIECFSNGSNRVWHMCNPGRFGKMAMCLGCFVDVFK